MAKDFAVQHEMPAQDRIVAAARKLFAERGFHQTAMADLAKEANVSVGAIYRSYASKADIVLAIIVADSEQTLRDLQDHADRVRRGEETIAAAIEDIVLHSLAEKKEALTHEIMAEAHRNPRVGDSVSGFCQSYREIFEDLAKLAAPSLAGEELEGAGALLLACLFGLAHRDLTNPRLDERASAKVATRLILNALAGAAPPD